MCLQAIRKVNSPALRHGVIRRVGRGLYGRYICVAMAAPVLSVTGGRDASAVDLCVSGKIADKSEENAARVQRADLGKLLRNVHKASKGQ